MRRKLTTMLTLALFMASVAYAAPVPDTGQTTSYTTTFGEDADYSINPHSYTDLLSSGSVLTGVVRDNVTGLEWQKVSFSNTYTWEEAKEYCDNLVQGGHDDWRLPTAKELASLVHADIAFPGPTIDPTFLPSPLPSVDFYCWTATSDASVTATDNAWLVSFNYGFVKSGDKDYEYYVRAVRGGQSANDFVDNGDGTVTDTSTGLMWQKVTPRAIYTWEAAINYCEDLLLAGYKDWRLPTRNELQSIVKYDTYDPAIDTSCFYVTEDSAVYTGPVSDYYWTSTTYAIDPRMSWLVDFMYGGVYTLEKKKDHVKEYGYYVRAVRGPEETLIRLESLEALAGSGEVSVIWSTASEIDNAGFNLYRAAGDGLYEKITGELIPAEGSPTSGAVYEYVDRDVRNRTTYRYLLEDVDLNGVGFSHGPVSATPRLLLGW